MKLDVGHVVTENDPSDRGVTSSDETGEHVAVEDGPEPEKVCYHN